MLISVRAFILTGVAVTITAAAQTAFMLLALR